MNKSLKTNAVINGVRTLLGLIFPLITYPYICRVLGVDNIGKVNFTNSIVNYFVLVAGLGISTYAIREGSRYKGNLIKFEAFINQVFTINILSTIIAYVLLFAVIVLFPAFEEYTSLILIQSLMIFGNTIGITWLYTIFEDYFYITIRTLAVQLISIIGMFIFVKTKQDILIYVSIAVFSNVGANIWAFLHSYRYTHLMLTRDIKFNLHTKPICILFASSIATTIYVNSNATMLGIFCGDYSTGLYGIASKVYSIVKSVVGALLAVTLPRLSSYVANNDDIKYKATLAKILNALSLILVPATIGLIIMSKKIIYILGGAEYTEATTTLQILAFALFFSMLATYLTHGILLPFKKEREVMVATILSAIANILLNFILLPAMAQEGAALTILAAEILIFIIQAVLSAKLCRIHLDWKHWIQVSIGSAVMGMVCILMNKSVTDMSLLSTLGIIILSAMLYAVIMLIAKNKTTLSFIKPIFNRIFKRW